MSEVQSPARGIRRGFSILGKGVVALVFAGAIVLLIVYLAGVFEPKVKPTASEVVEARKVLDRPTRVIERIRRPRLESAVGTVRAAREAIVASKILARIEDVRVKAGQRVEQGEILVVLDNADLKARIEQAVATEAAARARFDQAEIEQSRNARLKARETITQSDFDKSNSELKTARADYDRARRGVEEARILEAFSKVRAPFRGQVIDKKVNAGEIAVPGQALLTLFDPEHMQLIATVRESLALRLKVGQAISAQLDAFDFHCTAVVDEMVPESQVESRSFLVKVSGPCPPNVYSGMFGRIFVPLEDEEILVAPAAAVTRVGQVDEVEVVENGVIERRFVQLGREIDQGREILSGLKEGERVVLSESPSQRTKTRRGS